MTEVSKNIKESFHNTFIVLIFSAVVTFFLAFFVKNKKYLTMLHLETLICVVASIFYFVFLQKLTAPESIDWSSFTEIRYADWFFTTPMMLISLSIFLSINSNTVLSVPTMTLVIILNYIMLGTGYLGEIKQLSRMLSLLIGFISFFIMFYILHSQFVKNSRINSWLIGIYIVLWSLYGVVYILPEEQKNVMTNWLDLVTKGVIGLGTVGYLCLSGL